MSRVSIKRPFDALSDDLGNRLAFGATPPFACSPHRISFLDPRPFKRRHVDGDEKSPLKELNFDSLGDQDENKSAPSMPSAFNNSVRFAQMLSASVPSSLPTSSFSSSSLPSSTNTLPSSSLSFSSSNTPQPNSNNTVKRTFSDMVWDEAKNDVEATPAQKAIKRIRVKRNGKFLDADANNRTQSQEKNPFDVPVPVNLDDLVPDDSTDQPGKKRKFTREQVMQLIKLALDKREEQLKDEFFKILQKLLQEQYDSICEYNREYLSCQVKDSQMSYVS